MAMLWSFLKQGKLSISSKELKTKINSWLQNSDNNKKQKIVETLFKVIQSTGVSDFKELKTLNFKKLLSEVTEIDKSAKKLLLNTLTSFIK